MRSLALHLRGRLVVVDNVPPLLLIDVHLHPTGAVNLLIQLLVIDAVVQDRIMNKGFILISTVGSIFLHVKI